MTAEIVPTDEISSLSKKLEEQQGKIANFSLLLETLSDVSDKKKILWKQIYEHAVEDRTHAYMLFTSLYLGCKGNTAEHQISGPVLAKYIERMSRSNDQIIKLAELIQSAEDASTEMSEEDIYSKITGSKK